VRVVTISPLVLSLLLGLVSVTGVLVGLGVTWGRHTTKVEEAERRETERERRDQLRDEQARALTELVTEQERQMIALRKDLEHVLARLQRVEAHTAKYHAVAPRERM
jgi:hypothetical protein